MLHAYLDLMVIATNESLFKEYESPSSEEKIATYTVSLLAHYSSAEALGSLQK